MSFTTNLRPPLLPVLALRLIEAQIGEWTRQVAHVLGLRREATYWLSDPKIPDSELAKKATELVTEVSPAFLVNHSFRTYLFGAALGLRDRMSFDIEVLYLAAIMHDLGLTGAVSRI
jgi:HD domain-containing protein